MPAMSMSIVVVVNRTGILSLIEKMMGWFDAVGSRSAGCFVGEE